MNLAEVKMKKCKELWMNFGVSASQPHVTQIL